MTLLELKQVSYRADNKTILDKISLPVEKGDYISIVGPSGSGKSTFLKLCNHLICPSEGEIYFKDKNILEHEPTSIRKWLAYCPQSAYLFGDNVLDNLSFPFSIRNQKTDSERILHWLLQFGLTGDFLNKEVKGLSGGEKQRIALIRTLLFTPEMLLLDEITSALDEENTRMVEGIIQSLNDQGVTVLWITHHLEQSRRIAKRLLTIEAGRIKSVEVLK